MENKINIESLQFFGKIIASVSHEIKNVMAIINEKTGLLKDLASIAEKGSPIDPVRIQAVADEIKLQIKRGDTIVKNMNNFAHSADEPIQRVDLREMTSLIIMLSERFVSQMGVTLNLISSDKNIIIKTNPFLLEFLIWDCLQFAIKACKDTGTVNIAIEQSKNRAEIKYLLKDGSNIEPKSSFPEERTKILMEALCVKLFLNFEDHEFMISIPENIKGG